MNTMIAITAALSRVHGPAVRCRNHRLFTFKMADPSKELSSLTASSSSR
jgi:hypothetical protein